MFWFEMRRHKVIVFLISCYIINIKKLCYVPLLDTTFNQGFLEIYDNHYRLASLWKRTEELAFNFF